MSWQKVGGNRYYLRIHEVDRKVIREYFGRGPAAEQAAKEDLDRHNEMLARRQQTRDEIAQIESATKPLFAQCDFINLLASAALAAAGFHKHGGEWRRRYANPTILPA